MARLQHELRQRKPFRSAAHEAVVALMRTTDVVSRRLTAVVEPSGITLQQFNVLRILRGGGEEGVPTLEVAARMIEQTPGITRLLDRLEAKQLVRRERCPTDRRQHLCRVTPEGAALLATLEEPMHAAAEASMKRLTREERITFIRLLEAIRGVEADSEQSAG